MKYILAFFLLFQALADSKPNIIFIMSDDHTSQAIGAYGGRLAKLNPTPTIDQLAKEGIIMSNAFCSNSICTPSRASIMTGQYAHINGVLDLKGSIPSDQQYLAHEMRRAGYQTAMIGKWHLKKLPAAFDYYKVLPGQGKYFDPNFFEGTYGDEIGSPVVMRGHSSDCLTDSALDWLSNKRKPKQAFFLKFHFKAPHDFFHYAPRYENYLADVHIPEPSSLWDNKNNGSLATKGHKDELINHIGTSIGLRNTRRNYANTWAKGIKDETLAKRTAYQTYLKKYLRCVKGIDDNMKRLISYLKKENLYDNTIIIYTGDQGFMLGEHDYQDKRWAYEETMRMPFIIRYPKTIKAGSQSDAIIENIDYPAMMLDYAGVKTPSYMQGRSFRSILETTKEPKDWKQAAYYQYWMHMAHHDNPAHIAMRTKKYKLILYYGAKPQDLSPETPPAWELYDLENDPHELQNIYETAPKNLVFRLKKQFADMRKENGADNSKFAVNQVINDFWNYDEDDRQQAIQISKKYAESRSAKEQ
ncbi:sulfatase [Lentisphaera profundi]|uniref:Sulfatase n=1 Tax=Lentisphaera profundi TaxID=1658616 RepID=A0ABY7VQS8_9BACT|nr:sulfatase [Lentisphaera profundi]WDE96064.1 sulfatase [Lentisphaera profundi]